MGKAAAIMNEGICLQGIWLSEEVLLSKSTWEEEDALVNSNGNPFCNERAAHVPRKTTDNFLLSFYVKAGGDDRFLFPAAAEIKVPCPSLSTCATAGEIRSLVTTLSSEIFDRLQKYTGGQLPTLLCLSVYHSIIGNHESGNMPSIDTLKRGARKRTKTPTTFLFVTA
jgi:hypothetical protein